MTDLDIVEIVIYMIITYLTTFQVVRINLCWNGMHTILKVCKSVCGERNVSVKAMYIRMAKLGTNGPVTCFTKIHISL